MLRSPSTTAYSQVHTYLPAGHKVFCWSSSLRFPEFCSISFSYRFTGLGLYNTRGSLKSFGKHPASSWFLRTASRGAMADQELVCVSGSWVLMGYWLVRLLLRKGYRVRTTIRTSVDEAAAFMALDGAEERLELVQADLLRYNSLARAFSGCVGVFHSSQPLNLADLSDYPAEMIDHEVRGTLNVVEACANSESVRRLVLTSSLSTIVWDGKFSGSPSGQESSHSVVDEKCWSNMEFCREKKLWFPLSKTLVERNAWALATDKRLDLVVINSALVVGPRETTKVRESFLKETKEPHQRGAFAYVHVDDAAQAHILAFEVPAASGRYLCFDNLLSEAELLELLQGFYPNQSLMTRIGEAYSPHTISNEKVMRLGVKF